MIRQKLDIHSFRRSGEIPPLDQEDYIMWQFERMLLTENEAVKAIAEYRRTLKRPSRIKPRPLPVAPSGE